MSRTVRAVLAVMAVIAVLAGSLALNMADTFAQAGELKLMVACSWFGGISAVAALLMLVAAIRGRAY